MKLRSFLLAIIALLALVSCHKVFPVSNVRFSNQGGTKTLESVGCNYVNISSSEGVFGEHVFDEATMIETTTLDWLTAELNLKSYELTLTAQKNESGNKRTLYISGMQGNFSSSIPVYQEK